MNTITKQKLIEWLEFQIFPGEIASNFVAGKVTAFKESLQQARLLPDAPDNDAAVLITDLQRDNARLREVLGVLVKEGECYCSDELKNRGICGHCEARSALSGTKRDDLNAVKQQTN